MPTCLVLQHVEPERVSTLGEALGAAGVDLDVRETWSGGSVPTSVDGLGALVVMGGPMSASSDEGFPTRRAEITLLAEALARGVPVLGVCLGAQLLAVAAGGAVSRGRAGPEIGWGPVRLEATAASDPLLGDAPERLTVLHWHGDTYRLPDGAVRLASSERYPEQAFRVGPRAWGLQFHVEVDGTAIDAFLAAFGEDARSAGTTPEAIRAESVAALAALEPVRDRILGRFARIVAGGAKNAASETQVSSA